MDCEVIDIQDEELRTKKEYEGRLILIKRNGTPGTEEDPGDMETNYLKCHGCNCLHPLSDYTVDSTNDIVNITEEFQCLVVSDGRKFHVTNGLLVE
jgi:hypothetical protein